MPRILNIGHRGAKGHVAENTLASFAKAFELGADGIELDVHLSADGEIIVIHDHSVTRTTGQKGNVADLSVSQLNHLKIDGIHNIPTLAQTIDAITSNSR